MRFEDSHGRGRARYNGKSEDDDEEIATEKPKPIIIQSSQRGARLKEELLGKILPREKITVSLDNFPYYIEEETKTLLKESVASTLQLSKLRMHRSGFQTSSNRIMLENISGCTIPGTEIYREKLVSALAREMQVPLMKLDDDHGCDDERREDCIDDECYEYNNNKKKALKKGDRVMYVRETDVPFREANKRALRYGNRGDVYEVDSKRVAVVFNICGMKTTDAEYEERNTELLQKAIVIWLDGSIVRMRYNHRFNDEHCKNDQAKKRKNKIISSTRRGAALKAELLSKILPWEKITVSLENFPHYIDENSKSLLKECASSHLKQKEFRKYGSRLKSSSQKILLRTIPGNGDGFEGFGMYMRRV